MLCYVKLQDHIMFCVMLNVPWLKPNKMSFLGLFSQSRSTELFVSDLLVQKWGYFLLLQTIPYGPKH